MLHYGDKRDGKMKFLQNIIEKISILYKNFYYRGSTCRNILTYPDSTYQDRDLASPLRDGGASTISWSPPRSGGRSPLELMMLSQKLKEILKKSLSVMLKNSKFENLKYNGPMKIEF